MKIDLFDARALAPLVSFADQQGRAESYLDRVRIPGELIQNGGWITKKQAYDLALDVVQRSRSPDAVFKAYVDFRIDDLGPIAAAMKSCKTVKESLDVATCLGQIAYQGSQYFVKTEGATTWIGYREPKTISAGQTYINDMTLMVYVHFIRLLVDEEWRPEWLRTRGSVFDRHRRLDVFEDCQTDAHLDYSALAFPTEFLGRQTPWRKSEIKIDSTKAWQFGPAGSAPILDSLHRLVSSRFPYRKLPTLEQVALLVDASPATIKRELSSAGTTYGKLLDRIRYDAACEMLSIPQMTVKEISDELGYSGTNNFVRSFRRMTGLTPGEFRRQQSHGTPAP